MSYKLDSEKSSETKDQGDNSFLYLSAKTSKEASDSSYYSNKNDYDDTMSSVSRSRSRSRSVSELSRSASDHEDSYVSEPKNDAQREIIDYHHIFEHNKTKDIQNELLKLHFSNNAFMLQKLYEEQSKMNLNMNSVFGASSSQQETNEEVPLQFK